MGRIFFKRVEVCLFFLESNPDVAILPPASEGVVFPLRGMAPLPGRPSRRALLRGTLSPEDSGH